MKYEKPRIIFRCAGGCGRHTVTLHEIFYGTADRRKSIEYNIQVPLCQPCHTVGHTIELLQGTTPLNECREKQGVRMELSKMKLQEYFCRCLEIEREIVLLAFNQRNWEYLESIKDRCGAMIMTFEVF